MKFFAGGSFSRIGNVNTRCIGRWDGTSWSGFGDGTGGAPGGDEFSWVHCLAADDNHVYAGGGFKNINGVEANYIAVWDGNTWAPMGSGANELVLCLALHGSDVYAGGAFTNIGGVGANYIARWDGSSWSALGGGAEAIVAVIAVNDYGVYAGGNFSSMDGVPGTAYIAKWNGSSWSALGNGVDAPVYGLTLNGRDVYAGGLFSTIGGVNIGRVAKFSNGSWTAVGDPVDIAGVVRALSANPSFLIAGGSFARIGGVTNTKYVAMYPFWPAPVALDAYGMTSATAFANWLPYPFAENFYIEVGTGIEPGVFPVGTDKLKNILPNYNNVPVGNNICTCLQGLEANSEYYYSVKASNNIWFSLPSNIVKFKTTVPRSGGVFKITTPNGGEVLTGGSYYYINWSKIGGTVTGASALEYSTNNGDTWTKIETPPIAGVVRYYWKVPGINSNNCMVRICNYLTHKEYDRSDGTFSIITQIQAANFPNPFNPSTKIVFNLEKSSFTSLKVYNSIGKEAAELVNRQLEAGTHQFEFNAANLPSGVYFYTLKYGGHVENHKMLLLK